MSSAQLGGVIAESLAAAGVGEVVVCPGSRSTPIVVGLAASAAAGRLRLHTRTDERGAGFLALGLARATGIAAIVVTSGSAVGNLLPAVMEARASGVPLIVLSADRPATLVGTGANQTTRQAGIFGCQVVADLQLNSADANPAAWAQACYRIVAQARGVRTNEPGPVQVNAACAEPFQAASGHWTLPRPPAWQPRPAPPAIGLPPGPRTVVLAGDAPLGVGRTARRVAEQARVPLLAEPSSNARAGSCAIAGYRLLLDGALGERIERVVVFGHPTLSRPVLRLVSRPGIDLVVVSHRASWPDPGWRAGRVADAVELAPAGDDWLTDWLAADRSRPDPLANRGPITGPELAARVVAGCRGNMVFGASNPIRDADLAPIAAEPPICWANRGLAGIDGLLATAQGIALGSAAATTLLLGDLSFLHDVGSLHLPAGQPEPRLRIVVADDNGGSIFAGLEVARQTPQLLAGLFTMPHGRDLVRLAAGFGWPAHRVTERTALLAALAAPITGLEVLVVPVAAR